MSSRGLRIAGGAALVLYFVVILRDIPSMRFEIDDPNNIWIYWNAGFRHVLLANLTFWSTFYRPLGGLWYLTLYSLAKFNPLPYHLARVPLLALNVWLTWRLARDLTGSEWTAWFAALIMTYHGRLSGIYYSNDYIYDVLCYLCFYAGFAYYVGVRRRGRILDWRESACFLLLYIGALNAKEIGVMLPVLVLLYELMYRPASECAGGWKTWLGRYRVALFGCALAAAYLVGKRFGDNSLFSEPGYRPVFTLQRFWMSQSANWNTWIYGWPWFTPARTAILYVTLAAVAVIRKSPVLGLSLAIGILGTLPITFSEGRIGSATYVPMFGWALLLAIAITSGIKNLCRIIPAPRALLAAQTLVSCALLFLTWRQCERQRKWTVAYFHQHQAKINNVVEEFERHAPSLHPNSKVLIMDDPFPGAWDAYFVASLWYADKTLDFSLANTMEPKPGPADYDGFDYVLGFTPAGDLVQLKPRAEPATVF